MANFSCIYSILRGWWMNAKTGSFAVECVCLDSTDQNKYFIHVKYFRTWRRLWKILQKMGTMNRLRSVGTPTPSYWGTFSLMPSRVCVDFQRTALRPSREGCLSTVSNPCTCTTGDRGDRCLGGRYITTPAVRTMRWDRPLSYRTTLKVSGSFCLS